MLDATTSTNTDVTHDANSHSPTSTPAPSERARCFVGETTILTSFGACRISDLAKLSDNRDQCATSYTQAIAVEQTKLSQRLAAIEIQADALRAIAAPGLSDSFNAAIDETKATMQAQHAQIVAAIAAVRDEQLAACLPVACVRDPQTGEAVSRPFVKVWAQPIKVSSLVDVVIDVRVQVVDNVESEHYVKVRCTPEHVFLTSEGDVQAQHLAGKTIWRMHPDGGIDTFVVPEVQPIELPEPVAVYDAEVEGIASYCVAPDGGPSAVVHNSHYVRSVSELPDTGTREYSTFIHQSRYARWLDDAKRRETWHETVARYFDFFVDKLQADLSDAQAAVAALADVRDAMERLDIVPSMRALWSAGPSLKRCNVTAYNCGYLAVDSPRVFDEAVYILMSGCGLGFSVERQYVKKLPTIADDFVDSDTTITVADSRTGWARAYKELISLLYAGQVPQWDLSKLRPAGARLKTSGGRSSGPRPLDELFRFTVKLFREAAGRKLSSMECHDLMCMVGRIVVAGGVRRSAEISLSNPSDDRLRFAKSGQWWIDNEQRALANNSAAYTERPEFAVFMREWWALYESKSGERGIFNRVAAQHKAEAIGREAKDFGTNPCGEISLRSMQFCNLTEVVVRPEDTLETLSEKIRCATVLGTLQSDLLDFKYLRKQWRTNCEEERLLGVSLTGITDHPVLGDPNHPQLSRLLVELRQVARDTNREWAAHLGIAPSKAITTVKPSGTVSQLVNSSSGIHRRFAPYYVRRVRADQHDPLAQLMQEQGFLCEVDERTPSNLVFSLPIASPPTARFVADVDALTQAKLWHAYAKHWADHSVSCTIYYSDDEFLALGQWVWDHFDEITGLSFLPRSDHTYVQAPYEAITREEYLALRESMPTDVDWSRLRVYEKIDTTHGAKTYACSGDVCEIVDLNAGD